MSYLFNDPAAFTDEMIDGFVAAHRGLVRRVPGGVVRAAPTEPGQVAVVIGGGSGHYPAFAGLVGPGLAHGAAMGNVFASPSAQQVHSVAGAAASDAGVLLCYGNYAGDVLNFDQAQERLRADGVPCRTVVVTDDVMSAPEAERHRRRGIAGDLAVFRAAGWAAARGGTLDEVAALAAAANERTRSVGAAFTGCTLPGESAPLFTVPPGRMALGMGIHGEPGLADLPLPTADELAGLLVERLLESAPDGDRVAVIVNGLGAVKHEELFVLYRAVSRLLDDRGLRVVAPEVGEMVTSFDMAGVSLTLMWLTDDLERAWTSPAWTPAYRTGELAVPVPAPAGRTADPGARRDAVAPASAASRAAACVVADALLAAADRIDERAAELGRLDAVSGDGDHGIGMSRGATAAARAAADAAAAGAGARATLTGAADAWADRAGGTSGALWGVALRAVAARLSDTAAPGAADLAAGVADAAEAVGAAGRAEVGDKTMLDALVPFASALGAAVEAGAPAAKAWPSAAEAAAGAAAATADLVPRIGRARLHPEASRGEPDAGAVSFALVVGAAGEILKRCTEEM
ncbi:dihydroxyacetone kinase family protein [Actinomadura sp. WMMB 499]|uniref:dihydroxyacetone kinase family protein n=1 Tax=Actinomadura sp. WMMB 499 TaxID=1219491 RepID=UPI00124592C1|nr:dihydroxyacetone kinase family protein [Actinomadura sp. WMMB 499]QFG26261.1 dihydroxyacetone kinase family protein [Actinomadura sp. WMMB 499]